MKDKYKLTSYPQSFLVPMMLKDGKILVWYSICSRHRSHDSNCGLCNSGSWVEHRAVDTANKK